MYNARSDTAATSNMPLRKPGSNWNIATPTTSKKENSSSANPSSQPVDPKAILPPPATMLPSSVDKDSGLLAREEATQVGKSHKQPGSSLSHQNQLAWNARATRSSKKVPNITETQADRSPAQRPRLSHTFSLSKKQQLNREPTQHPRQSASIQPTTRTQAFKVPSPPPRASPSTRSRFNRQIMTTTNTLTPTIAHNASAVAAEQRKLREAIGSLMSLGHNLKSILEGTLPLKPAAAESGLHSSASKVAPAAVADQIQPASKILEVERQVEPVQKHECPDCGKIKKTFSELKSVDLLLSICPSIDSPWTGRHDGTSDILLHIQYNAGSSSKPSTLFRQPHLADTFRNPGNITNAILAHTPAPWMKYATRPSAAKTIGNATREPCTRTSALAKHGGVRWNLNPLSLSLEDQVGTSITAAILKMPTAAPTNILAQMRILHRKKPQHQNAAWSLASPIALNANL